MTASIRADLSRRGQTDDSSGEFQPVNSFGALDGLRYAAMPPRKLERCDAAWSY